MKSILKQKFENKAAWLGKDLKQNQQWVYHLTENDLTIFDTLVLKLNGNGLEAPLFTKNDFEITDTYLLSLFYNLADELENGYGFFVLKGLNNQRYSEKDLKNIYYGIGLYLGKPVSQNPKGDLLGNVENVGDKNNKSTRVYETNSYLPYHTDLSDVVGLICIRKAKEGGLSSLVSATTVYNKILEQYPEYLSYYYHPAPCDHLGDAQPTLTPIFSYYENKLSCRYMRAYIELGHEKMQLKLSEVQKEALDIFDSFIHDPELKLDMMLEPGDIQFCNNYMIMHSRTSFEDYEAVPERRKLLRLWLKMPNARSLAPEFPGRNGIPALI